MADEPTYFRKGFGLKTEVEATLTADYDGQLVDLLLAREHTLVAGDLTPPAGEYSSTLDVIDSGVLDRAGLKAVGVAGHPEGNPNIPADVAWEALRRKQAWGERTGIALHVATQFGFDTAALAAFDAGLTARGITLPVHVGVAGPGILLDQRGPAGVVPVEHVTRAVSGREGGRVAGRGEEVAGAEVDERRLGERRPEVDAHHVVGAHTTTEMPAATITTSIAAATMCTALPAGRSRPSRIARSAWR